MNVVLLQHFLGRFKYHTEDKALHVEDSRVLSLAVMNVFSLDPSTSETVVDGLKFAEKVVDIGFLAVRIAR